MSRGPEHLPLVAPSQSLLDLLEEGDGEALAEALGRHIVSTAPRT